jgi:hypothetical protein
VHPFWLSHKKMSLVEALHPRAAMAGVGAPSEAPWGTCQRGRGGRGRRGATGVQLGGAMGRGRVGGGGVRHGDSALLLLCRFGLLRSVRERRQEGERRRKKGRKRKEKRKKYGNFSKLENFQKIKDNL